MKKLFTLTLLASSTFLITFLLSQANVQSEIASRTTKSHSSTTTAHNNQTLVKSDLKKQQSEYTGIVKQVDDIAEQITVRILNLEDSSHGSGVIIAKNNNTYYLATAKHVIKEKQKYQIVTPDGATHQVDDSSIIRSGAYDLAILSFTSEQTYEIATLGNYRVGQNSNQAVFVSGFPQAKDNLLPPRMITGGFAQQEDEIEFRIKDYSQLSQSVPENGQGLVYTNISHRGMSGGAVLDAEGKLVGINTGAENAIYVTESGKFAEFSLGYALGVSTQELIGFVSTQPNLKKEWLKEVENKDSARSISANERQNIENQLLVATEPSNSADTVAWMNFGNQLWRYDKYAEAIAAFERVIAINNPQFELDKAYYALGLAHSYHGDYQQAAVALTKAIKIQPKPYFYWRRLGRSYSSLELYEQAISAYEQAIARNQQDFVLYVEQGDTLSKVERYPEAIKAYNQAVKLNPQHHWIYNNRGMALDDLGKHEVAISSYDKALEFKPNSHQAWNNRGAALDNLGKYKVAIFSYDKALEFKSDSHQAWHNRGITLENLGKHKEAIFSYDKALEFRPDLYQAWYNRGVSLGSLGKYEAALFSFDKALEFKPDYHEALFNRSMALSDLGQYREALSSFDKVVEFKPNDYEAWYNRGVVLSNLGQYREAISSYDKTLEFKSDKYQAWNNRGIALGNLGQYRQAISSYDKALEFKPDDHQAWHNRGVALGNLGKYAEAEQSWEKAAELARKQNNLQLHQQIQQRLMKLRQFINELQQ